MKTSLKYTTKSGRTLTRNLPAQFVVCDECRGKGSHLVEGMRGAVYTWRDFEEDPDFRNDYFGGAYDVPCETCHGERLVTVPEREALTRSEARFLDMVERVQFEREREEAYLEAERRAEMGWRW
jgi:hypothetical protein